MLRPPNTNSVPTSDRDQAYEERLRALTESYPPRDARERALVEHAALALLKHDHVVQLQTDRITAQIADAARRDDEEIDRLAQRLFRWRNRPIEQYGTVNHFRAARRRSRERFADDPATLVRELERSLAGCRWMRNEWAELRGILERGGVWEPQHKLKCIRLLGRREHQAAFDPDVFDIAVASWLLHPKRAHPFCELTSDVRPGQYRYFLSRLRAMRASRTLPPDAQTARRMLVALIDRTVERLEAMVAAAQDRAEQDAARRADCLSFDFSPEGERLRKAEDRYFNTFLSALDQLIAIRKNGGKAAPMEAQSREEPVAPTAKSPISNGEDGVSIPATPRRTGPTPQPGAPDRSRDEDLEPQAAEILPWIPEVRRTAGVPAAACADALFLGSEDSALADYAAWTTPGVTPVTQGFSLRHAASPLPATA
jgi:hypothetical protein